MGDGSALGGLFPSKPPRPDGRTSSSCCLLGWNRYVYHTHLDGSPPLEQPPARPVAWHQDSMRVNEEIECHPRPRLSLKVGYYLTDVSGPDWGSTLLLPGLIHLG